MKTDGALLTARINANSLGHPHLIEAWTVWAAACVLVMFVLPDREAIPYYLGWAGFALAFGFGTWRRWQLITSLAWYTLATSVALNRSLMLRIVAWDEISTEIPLMILLTMLMAWQLRRSRTAQAQVMRLAERDAQASRDRERLMQLTSHELRTPLTIARGYVEVMQARVSVLENQQDLAVIADELDRLSRVSDRLIRMMQLQRETTSEIVDFDQVLKQVFERWQVVADRRWSLVTEAGLAQGSPERIRTCLDTLVENAIRYTSQGDMIRFVGSRHVQHVVLSVLDSGVGLTEQQIIDINAFEPPPQDTKAGTTAGVRSADPLARTGLGLGIVREAVHEFGGTLRAWHTPGGGAALTLTYPLKPTGEPGTLLVASGRGL